MVSKEQMSKFPQVFTLADFGVNSDVTLVPGQWSKIGQKRVEAQRKATFGIGSSTGSNDTREPLYISLVDVSSGKRIEGKVRLSLSNSNETEEHTVMENRTERLRAAQNDRSQAVLLGEFPMTAKEDSLLLLKMNIDASSTVDIDYDAANTKALIPATIYQ